MKKMTPLRFINDVIKPWDELNQFLRMDYALQPDLSDVTRLAGQIAVSLRHQLDFSELTQSQAFQKCPVLPLIVDAGDYWKHGELRDSTRNCKIVTASNFEYSEGNGFRFIRNKALLDHPEMGEHDFLEISLAAIHFWIQQHGFDSTWDGAILESDRPFEPAARLRFEPRYCIHMSSTRIQIVRSVGEGDYQPYAPADVRFEVY